MSATITFQIPTDLERVKRDLVKLTVDHYNGDKKMAAKALGVSLKTIYNFLSKEKPIK